jgi:hypothetical protein
MKNFLSFHQAKTGQLGKQYIDLFWTTPVYMAASVHRCGLCIKWHWIPLCMCICTFHFCRRKLVECCDGRKKAVFRVSPSRSDCHEILFTSCFPPSSKEKQKRGKKEEPVLESLGSDILKRNASTDLAFSRQFWEPPAIYGFPWVDTMAVLKSTRTWCT